MRKIITIVLIFLVSFVLFTKVHSSQHTRQSPSSNSRITTNSPSPTPIVGLPQTISIPSIDVHAAVEQVGLDTQGRMGVPENVSDTAWYKYGYRPGQKGSAVIDGHFDTVTGAPAVFYNISHIKIGDTISVTDDQNHTYVFSVSQVTSYAFNQLPMQQIFASTDKQRLNLITCAGTWDRKAHNYSNRAVVYSVLTTAR